MIRSNKMRKDGSFVVLPRVVVVIRILIRRHHGIPSIHSRPLPNDHHQRHNHHHHNDMVVGVGSMPKKMDGMTMISKNDNNHNHKHHNVGRRPVPVDLPIALAIVILIDAMSFMEGVEMGRSDRDGTIPVLVLVVIIIATVEHLDVILTTTTTTIEITTTIIEVIIISIIMNIVRHPTIGIGILNHPMRIIIVMSIKTFE